MVLKLLALHQPMAADLRFITSAMRINTELERIGRPLCQHRREGDFLEFRSPSSSPTSTFPGWPRSPREWSKMFWMLFVKGDADLARSVCERDDQVDALNDQVFRELLTTCSPTPRRSPARFI